MSKRFRLYNENNLDALKKLPDNSIDSVVSDPPYALNFMNARWDAEVPSVDFWREVYRVLKPGGHILSFGGTRTYHRMVVNIEDAGFEIRDQIMWIYGSGFPKSLNVGKAVDKLEGNKREVIGERTGAMNNSETSEAASFVKDGVGFKTHFVETKGSSEYEGWGTALKPANEPICLARKPLSEKSVAENVLKWRTGGINVDGCRIGYQSEEDKLNTINAKYTTDKDNKQSEDWGTKQIGNVSKEEGRFPANIILDETAADMLDQQSGNLKSTGAVRGKDTDTDPTSFDMKKKAGNNSNVYAGQTGGASRYFYVAKVSKKERNLGLDGFEDKTSQLNSGGIGRKTSVEKRLDTNGENAPTTKNTHPTVKPINLLTYLCRLITPPNGIILDPFMGSGSTGIAAQLEGFRFVGMEMDEDYFKIAEARIEAWEKYKSIKK